MYSVLEYNCIQSRSLPGANFSLPERCNESGSLLCRHVLRADACSLKAATFARAIHIMSAPSAPTTSSSTSSSFRPEPRFNHNNVVITASEVQDIINGVFARMLQRGWRTFPGQGITPCQVTDARPFIRAFTHSSYRAEMIELQRITPPGHRFFIPESDYELLEFNGDAALTAIIVNYLISAFPNENEHFLTTLKIRLVQKQQYALFARHLNFDRYVLLSSHLEQSTTKRSAHGSRANASILEDVFEAFVGAMLEHWGFDRGMQLARTFVIGVLEETVNLTQMIMSHNNFKDSAIQYLRSNGWGDRSPFQQVYSFGPPNQRVFCMAMVMARTHVAAANASALVRAYHDGVRDNLPDEHVRDPDVASALRSFLEQTQRDDSLVVGCAIERTKRAGEQAAAHVALQMLGVDPNFTLLNGSHANRRRK